MDEVHFLPGNHELLLAGAMDEAGQGREALGNKSQAACWAMNGGHAFMSEVAERFDLHAQACPVDTMTQFADALLRVMPEGFAETVRSWPSHFRIGDVLCVHAGVAPKKPLCDTLNLSQQSHWPTTLRDRERSDRHWAWIREKFLAWQGGWPTSGKKDAETGLLVVHGHSVAPGASLRKLTDGPSLEKVLCRAATNGRICLDAGSSRNVGVAAMVMTAEAHRLAFAPCEA